MLEHMSSSETIAISTIYKKAAESVASGQCPAHSMGRLRRILENSHIEGRLSNPQPLFEVLETALHFLKAAPQIAEDPNPIALGISIGAADLLPARAIVFARELNV